MSLILRDYQQEAIDLVMASYEQNPSGSELLVMATGSGKTILFSEIARRLAQRGVLTLVLAHRDELLDQAIEKYHAIDPEAVVGKVAGKTNEMGGVVTVASVATACKAKRLKQLQQFNYGLIIVDEAHHLAAASYQTVLNAFGNAFVLLVTATPDRLDGKPIIDKPPLITRGIRDLVKLGYLCTPRAIAIKTETSLDDVGTRMGDFNEQELSNAVDTPARNKRIVDAYREHADGMATIAFCVTVQHAQSLAYTFNDHGIPAQVVTGETSPDDRKQIYADLKNGMTKIVLSVQVLTEGFDEPCVRCIIMARPTKSRALYVQCLDEKTEILTPYGWKCKDEITPGTLVAAFDKETGAIQWLPALNKVERPLGPDEKMYALQSPTMDIRVTGGHRMLHRVRNKKGKSEWRFIEAQDLYERTNGYDIPIAGYQEAPGVPLTDDELRFIGWFMTDGGLNPINGQITISQAAHQPHHEAIKSCIEGCGFKYGIHECVPRSQFHANSNSIRYTISKGEPRGRDKHLTGWARLEPFLDKNFSPLLDDMTAEQLEIMLEAIHLGDGAKQLGQYWTRRNYHITKGNKTFIERLQSLCVRRGYKCNASTVKKGENIAYCLHSKKTTSATVGGKHSSDGRPCFQVSPSADGETVWCVENELGTLVTRRNGKVSIVGNCVGRGARLHPGKDYFLVLDITDNTIKHRLTPHNLNKALDLKLLDGETIEEAEEREAREAREEHERQKQIRRLKEKRKEDLVIDLLQKFDWQKRESDGAYILQFGRGHKVALQPHSQDRWNLWDVPVYSVWIALAPLHNKVKITNVPLSLADALELAEKEVILIQARDSKKLFEDPNATWRFKPIDPTSKQYQLALRMRIPIYEGMTKGELSDALDQRMKSKKKTANA